MFISLINWEVTDVPKSRTLDTKTPRTESHMYLLLGMTKSPRAADLRFARPDVSDTLENISSLWLKVPTIIFRFDTTAESRGNFIESNFCYLIFWWIDMNLIFNFVPKFCGYVYLPTI